jgi:hypothetical protein
MIRVVHPGSGSRIRILTFYPSRIERSKRHRIPDLQNRLPEIQLLWMNVRAAPSAGWEDVLARKLVHIPQVEILF